MRGDSGKGRGVRAHATQSAALEYQLNPPQPRSGIGKYSNNSAGPPWATECSLCPAGRYNIYTAQPSCTACSEGKLSSADRTSCGGESPEP